MIVFYIVKGAGPEVTLTDVQPATTQAASLQLINNGPIDTFSSLVNALVAQTKASPAINFYSKVQIGT